VCFEIFKKELVSFCFLFCLSVSNTAQTNWSFLLKLRMTSEILVSHSGKCVIASVMWCLSLVYFVAATGT
jgi:hypothetical protein